MDDVTALYRELDPLRPLRGDEDALYVDWQRRLDPGGRDAKSLLIKTFRQNASPQRPITRLLTGHRGSGKTTELNRVRDALAGGTGGAPKVFVSMLFADAWLDLDDVQPEDLVLQIVRQLVTDLSAAGVRFGEQKLQGFFASMWERVKGARLDAAEFGIDPLKFGFRFEQFPTQRDEFRKILRGQLSTIFDLINTELLPPARRQLAALGFTDVLLVVDDLDRMPPKGDGGIAEHRSLFLDGSAVLRAVNCSMLLTVPIELAYSTVSSSLRDVYGHGVHTVPVLPVVDRGGNAAGAAEDALVEVLGRRAQAAFGTPQVAASQCAARIFADEDVLRRVVQLSGGHLRSLLVILSELLDWVDVLPIDAATVDRVAVAAAHDLVRALAESDRALLRRIAADGEPPEHPRFHEFLRDRYVFAYHDDAGYWYGLNPLLREVVL